MELGDYIRTRYIVEVAGVATAQYQDWQIDGIGTDSLQDKLEELALAWFTARRPLLGTNCLFSCMHYMNLSRNEQLAVYPGLAGQGGSDAIHPQYQVVRINTYTAVEILRSKVLRGSTNISGVIEGLSTRGRINDMAEFDNARLFESARYDAGPTGLTMDPHLRWLDESSPPPIYRFTQLEAAVVNPTFLTLRSRKTKICGVL